MSLFAVVLQVVAVVLALNAVGLYALAGVESRRRALRTARSNARAVAPTALVLGVVLAVNGLVRDLGAELSWLIGLNVTGLIRSIEGSFVADLQSLATPELTAYFGFVYVFGYVFLLTFPLLLYLLCERPGPLHTTLVAYGVNYAAGLVCYVLFVAYGPRNLMPELVDSLLYTTWPAVQSLTSRVNVNTNVFPSLHASLSATVTLLAYRHHAVAPRWTPVAGTLAASIAVATMYLGIHWLVDVLAGLVLAVGSVVVATRLSVGDVEGERRERLGESLRR